MYRILAVAALAAILSGPAVAGGDELTHREKLAVSAKLLAMGCVIGDIEDVERDTAYAHDSHWHHHSYSRHADIPTRSIKDGGGVVRERVSPGYGAYAGTVYYVDDAICRDGHDYDIKFDGNLNVIKMHRD